MIMITPKEILQIDATILAGILILLSLVFIGGKPILLEELEKDPSERTIISEFTKTPVAWIYGIGVLFSLSAFFAFLAIFKEDKTSSNFYIIPFWLSVIWMGFGFLIFIVAFGQLGSILINK